MEENFNMVNKLLIAIIMIKKLKICTQFPLKMHGVKRIAEHMRLSSRDSSSETLDPNKGETSS